MASNDRRLIVVTLGTGRLANRLVLFANLISFAEEYGCRLVNPTFPRYAAPFGTPCRDIFCRYPAVKRRSVFDLLPGAAPAIRKTRAFYIAVHLASRINQRHSLLGRKIVTLNEFTDREVTLLDGPEVQDQIRGARIIFAHGWRFRAPDLMRRHAEKIRTYFRPAIEIENESRALVERLRGQAEVVVGVHIRQRDYRYYFGAKYFFEAGRYAGWMREMEALFPGRKVGFLVCSDEPRHQEEFAGLRVEIGGGPAAHDLVALAKCDYIIGTMSTFAQWASFFGNVPLLYMLHSEQRVELDRFRVSFFEEIP